MTNEQARECFNDMIEAFRVRGDMQHVSELEIAREYFLNPNFREQLHDYLWEKSKHNLEKQ